MKLINWSLILYFLLPFVVFLIFFKPVAPLNLSELKWALENSIIQSGSAAFLSIFFGLGFAIGLRSLTKKFKVLFLNLLLIPQILPALFSILIVLSIISPFPMGSFGVILIFTFINSGLAGFILHHALQKSLNQYGLIADVYGLSGFKFLVKVLIPSIKEDIKQCFLTIFLFCFTSISVPLVAGGGKGTNLEVLIYEKIFIDQNWSAAWALNLLQTILIVALSYLIVRSQYSYKEADYETKRLKSKLMAAALGFYVLLYVGGYLKSVYYSLGEIDFLSDYKSEIFKAFLNNVKLYILTAILFSFFCMAWILNFVKAIKHVWVRHLFSVSTILVGFSLYLLFPTTEKFDFIKAPLAFSFLTFIVIFRSFYMNSLDSLKSQILVSQVYGLNFLSIFFEIIWPQTKKEILFCFSVLFIWQFSDFAILKSLGAQVQTLGLISEDFMSSYRLNASLLMSFIILVVWVMFNMGLFLVSKISFKSLGRSYVKN